MGESENEKIGNLKQNSFFLLGNSLNHALEYKEKLLAADKNR